MPWQQIQVALSATPVTLQRQNSRSERSATEPVQWDRKNVGAERSHLRWPARPRSNSMLNLLSIATGIFLRPWISPPRVSARNTAQNWTAFARAS